MGGDCVCEIQSKLIIHTRHKHIPQFTWRLCITMYCARSVNNRTNFLISFFFCRGLAQRFTGNSLLRSQCWNWKQGIQMVPQPSAGLLLLHGRNSTAPCRTVASRGGDYSIVYAFWSCIFTLLSGWFSHPQNGSIIQSQTPIHTTPAQLTQPDT